MAGDRPNPVSLRGRRILLVEDDFLVAEVISAILEEDGAVVVGPVGSVSEALTFIASRTADFHQAVLDLNLHGARSYAVADALLALGIGFVFTTGYDASTLEEPYRSYPHCMKPVARDELVAALMRCG